MNAHGGHKRIRGMNEKIVENKNADGKKENDAQMCIQKN